MIKDLEIEIVKEILYKFSENIDEIEMIYNVTLNNYENVFGSSTIYTALFAIVFLIIIGISNAFIYFH